MCGEQCPCQATSSIENSLYVKNAVRWFKMKYWAEFAALKSESKGGRGRWFFKCLHHVISDFNLEISPNMGPSGSNEQRYASVLVEGYMTSK